MGKDPIVARLERNGHTFIIRCERESIGIAIATLDEWLVSKPGGFCYHDFVKLWEQLKAVANA